MRHNRKRALLVAVGCVVVIAYSIILHSGILSIGSTVSYIGSAGTFIIYITCAIAWGITAADWTARKQIKTMLLLSTLLMVLWVCARTLRYDFIAHDSTLSLLLWYSYYIPMLILPLFGFHASTCMGRSLNWKTPWPFFLLYVVALGIAAGILTNNLHQLAFDFNGAPSDRSYTHGPVYFVAAGWMAVFTLATIIQLIHKCRLGSSWRRAILPFAVVVATVAYCILYNLDLDQVNVRVVEMTAVLCMAYILFWESSFASGLVVTSSQQEALFDHSPLAARILDARGREVYVSAVARDLDEESEGLRTQTAPIRGGSVQWSEDVHDLEHAQAELSRVKRELEEGNALLEAENATKRLQAAARSQSALYDQMSLELSDRLDTLNMLISEAQAGEVDADEALRVICVMGSYMKRRSNLLILGQDDLAIPAEELRLCLLESAKALEACGLAVGLHGAPRGHVPLDVAKSLYDTFEDVVEATLGDCSSYEILFAVEGRRAQVIVDVDCPATALKDAFAEAESPVTVYESGGNARFLIAESLEGDAS